MVPLGIAMAWVWGTCKIVDAQTAREAFVRQYCTECHAGSEAEGNFNLESIDYNVDPLDSFSKWEQIFDRVDKKRCRRRALSNHRRENYRAS